jgi:hypothetical protein
MCSYLIAGAVPNPTGEIGPTMEAATEVAIAEAAVVTRAIATTTMTRGKATARIRVDASLFPTKSLGNTSLKGQGTGISCDSSEFTT